MNKTEALNRLSALENEAKELRKIIEDPEQITPEERFAQLIEGWDYKVDLLKYPDCIFFFKGGKCLFDCNFKSDILWVNYDQVWSVFDSEFLYIQRQVQSLIKNRVEKHFNLKETTPLSCSSDHFTQVEKHFNLKEITPNVK